MFFNVAKYAQKSDQQPAGNVKTVRILNVKRRFAELWAETEEATWPYVIKDASDRRLWTMWKMQK